MPALGAHAAEEAGYYWIIGDTGPPKKGRHSVGVARQYCGQLGKQDNCEVAVSLSIATQRGSLPIAWQLYVPKEWIDDRERARRAGIPDDQDFATKPRIALAQLTEAIASGIVPGILLADAGYGDETAFRDGINELGVLYAVGFCQVDERRLPSYITGSYTNHITLSTWQRQSNHAIWRGVLLVWRDDVPRSSDVWATRSAVGSGRSMRETPACDAHRESRTSGVRACGSAGLTFRTSRRQFGVNFVASPASERHVPEHRVV